MLMLERICTSLKCLGASVPEDYELQSTKKVMEYFFSLIIFEYK
jgi:hypothetical protein